MKFSTKLRSNIERHFKMSREFTRRLSIILCGILVFAIPQVLAYTQQDVDCTLNSTCFYNPADCPPGGAGSGTTTADATTGFTPNTAAAQAAAEKASTGGTQVGYAIYDSSGDQLGSNNSTFENYGASITKSMILVAYLQQVANGKISAAQFAAEKEDVTQMIEVSSDPAANAVYADLNNPAGSVQAVADAVGMSGFKFNDTGDSLYVLGQSQITADDFAKFFSVITQPSYLPASELKFAEGLLSTITPNVGILQASIPGVVYSKEGWKPEPGGGSDPAKSGNANPFGNEGAPWVVNQAAQFTIAGTTYGIAVTVGGTASQDSGQTIIKDVATALMTKGAASTGSASTNSICCASQSSTAVTAAAAAGASSGPNVKVAFTFFVANGFTPQEAAGIVGNLQEESTNDLDPTIANGSGNYGIAQWGEPRLSAMRLWVSGKEGGDPASLGGQTGKIGQLNYIIQELNTSYNNVDKAVKSENTIDAVVHEWNYYYEASGAPDGPRDTNAQAVYAEAVKDGWITAGSQSPTTTASTPTCSTVSTTTSARCSTANSVTGDAKILAEATCYQGLYYEYGGGHDGYAAFIKACPNPQNPPNPPGNHPTGGPSLDGGLSGNPSPCATDCSALVSVAVDTAFHQTFDWTVGAIETSPDWKEIPLNSAVQPGDVVTIGADEHVEIVDHYDTTSNLLYTFGSHETGTQTGQVSSTLSGWTGAYRYVGPEN
jgi:hypothetical protein